MFRLGSQFKMIPREAYQTKKLENVTSKELIEFTKTYIDPTCDTMLKIPNYYNEDVKTEILSPDETLYIIMVLINIVDVILINNLCL